MAPNNVLIAHSVLHFDSSGAKSDPLLFGGDYEDEFADWSRTDTSHTSIQKMTKPAADRCSTQFAHSN